MFLATCGFDDFDQFVGVWSMETSVIALEGFMESPKFGADILN